LHRFFATGRSLSLDFASDAKSTASRSAHRADLRGRFFIICNPKCFRIANNAGLTPKSRSDPASAEQSGGFGPSGAFFKKKGELALFGFRANLQ